MLGKDGDRCGEGQGQLVMGDKCKEKEGQSWAVARFLSSWGIRYSWL